MIGVIATLIIVSIKMKRSRDRKLQTLAEMDDPNSILNRGDLKEGMTEADRENPNNVLNMNLNTFGEPSSATTESGAAIAGEEDVFNLNLDNMRGDAN